MTTLHAILEVTGAVIYAVGLTAGVWAALNVTAYAVTKGGVWAIDRTFSAALALAPISNRGGRS